MNQACISCEIKECTHSAARNFLMDCKVCNYGQLILMPTSKSQYVALCNNFKCSQAYNIGDDIKSVEVLDFDVEKGYHKLKVGPYDSRSTSQKSTRPCRANRTKD